MTSTEREPRPGAGVVGADRLVRGDRRAGPARPARARASTLPPPDGVEASAAAAR